MRTTTVIDGKLCIEQDGVKVWFTLTFIDKNIAKLEQELSEWRARRQMLTPSPERAETVDPAPIETESE